MSETEAKAQGQKPKSSWLAILSLILAIAAFTGVFIIQVTRRFCVDLWGRLNSGWLGPCGLLLVIMFISTFGIISGAVAYKKVRKSHGLLTGRGIARAGQFISIMVFVWACFSLLVMVIDSFGLEGRITKELMCSVNLSGLGKEMLIYANDYDDQYPTADKWCDLLMEYAEVSEKSFVCRSAGEGRSHYAINPNAEPNSPPDMVLLFETKGGWNQFGGPEILTFENHKGEGCNVLFNDSHVEFVKPERLGELKWEVEGKER